MQTETIGAKIADLRKKKGYTQADLGNLLNVSAQAVSKWERGEAFPDFDTFSRIAKLFGVSISYFESETAVAETAIKIEKGSSDREMVGVCKECGKVVYAGDEGKLVPYLYCKTCNEKLILHEKERALAQAQEAERKRMQAEARILAQKDEARRGRNKGLIWASIIVGVLFIASVITSFQSENVWEDLGYSVLGAVFFYTFIAQLFWGGAVIDCILLGGKIVGTPGIIFEFSLDGFIFLIVMKLLFAVIKFIIWLASLLFFVILAWLFSPFTFVPALIRVNKHGV